MVEATTKLGAILFYFPLSYLKKNFCCSSSCCFCLYIILMSFPKKIRKRHPKDVADLKIEFSEKCGFLRKN